MHDYCGVWSFAVQLKLKQEMNIYIFTQDLRNFQEVSLTEL